MKPPKTDQKPISLIYSYSHKDEALCDKLETHLSLLKRQGILHTWHDRKIGAGQEWEGEIDKNLEAANIILLLVSADFLASDYCFDKEMRRALEKHEAGEARVIPVIIRPVDWGEAPFSKLQALPTGGKPVTSWSNQDEAWTDVAKGIRKTIQEIQRTSTQLTLPFPSDTPDRTAKASPALTILQACPDGVPLEVIAAVLSYSQQDLERHLTPLVTEKMLVIEGSLGSTVSPLRLPDLPNASDILSRALEELLAFIDRHKGDEAARSQVVNAVALAKQCSSSRPHIVANVFRTLDKLLKRRGDKRLVLEVAELSIDAAQRATRTREVIKGEAHALICGRSWVLQRIGRLAEARVAAERSLRFGEDIGWDRNTAYCKKCIGRLYRMEAEEQKGAQKAALLSQSTSYLKDAIERFKRMGDFGPTHPEVGDCYSLLARTYLVAGRMSEADAAVRQAYSLTADQGSKDYLDLLILSGDLQVARGERKTAASLYDEALRLGESDDPEISEMRARAYMARGWNKEALKDQQGALHDYRKAAELYRQLRELEASATARWEELRLRGEIPREALPLLQSERVTVRIAALARHEQRARTRSQPALARRGGASKSYWQQLIHEARAQAAAEETEW